MFAAEEALRICYTLTMGWLTIANGNGNKKVIVVNILTVKWLTIANGNGNVNYLHT